MDVQSALIRNMSYACPVCPPGYGAPDSCAMLFAGYNLAHSHRKKENLSLKCNQCISGSTYSSIHSQYLPCQRCAICRKTDKVIRNCSSKRNTACLYGGHYMKKYRNHVLSTPFVRPDPMIPTSQMFSRIFITLPYATGNKSSVKEGKTPVKGEDAPSSSFISLFGACVT